MFRDREIHPGKAAHFAITSTLEPEKTLLIVSGIDPSSRRIQRESLLAQGVSLHFFRYIASQLGTRGYRIYRMSEHVSEHATQ
jgi:hypothetical protein